MRGRAEFTMLWSSAARIMARKSPEKTTRSSRFVRGWARAVSELLMRSGPGQRACGIHRGLRRAGVLLGSFRRENGDGAAGTGGKGGMKTMERFFIRHGTTLCLKSPDAPTPTALSAARMGGQTSRGSDPPQGGRGGPVLQGTPRPHP